MTVTHSFDLADAKTLSVVRKGSGRRVRQQDGSIGDQIETFVNFTTKGLPLAPR